MSALGMHALTTLQPPRELVRQYARPSSIRVQTGQPSDIVYSSTIRLPLPTKPSVVTLMFTAPRLMPPGQRADGAYWHSRFTRRTACMLRLFRATRPAINRRQ